MSNSNTKHSPGPWTVSNLRVHDANGLSVCEMSCSAAEDIANASLIAACPEMYEALKQSWAALEHLRDTVHDDKYLRDGCTETMGEIERAIAKAEGRSE